MNRHDNTPTPTVTRPPRPRRLPLISPLVAGAVVAASLISTIATPPSPATNARAGAAGGTEVSSTQTGAVRSVALARPIAAARGNEPLTCPGRRAGGRGRSGESAIQIDIRLEQPTRTRNSSSRRGSTGRDSGPGGPLVVGCGPDGQVIVLACDTRRTGVDRDRAGSRERREGYRDRTRFDTDYRDRYDLEDLQDLDLADLLDLSDAGGLSLDELVERAELDGLVVDGPTGRVEIGNPQRRDQSRQSRRAESTRASWWDLYTSPRDAADRESEGSMSRPRALSGNGSARLVRAGGHTDLTDSTGQRGLRGRGERSGVCRWLGR